MPSSSCTIKFDITNHWLRATWRGFVNPQQALHDVIQHLDVLSVSLVPYFLNDNSRVLNPWFDSLTWLRYVWEHTHALPPAYVAHVMQPGSSANASDLDTTWTHRTGTDLQVFESVQEAREWLRQRRRGR